MQVTGIMDDLVTLTDLNEKNKKIGRQFMLPYFFAKQKIKVLEQNERFLIFYRQILFTYSFYNWSFFGIFNPKTGFFDFFSYFIS